jgi:hypothetical protein
MVYFSHLELFHGVGRGGHRHDDTRTIVGVMGVNILQMVHEFHQHGGHPGTPLVSSLPGLAGDSRSVQPGSTIAPLGEQIKLNPIKKAGNLPPDFSAGEHVDSLLVQVNRRLRQDFHIENLGVFDIPLHCMRV